MPGEFKRSCISSWATEKGTSIDDACPHRCSVDAMALESVDTNISDSDAEQRDRHGGYRSSAVVEPPADIATLIEDAEDGTGLV
jgi:hypothetical protein